MFKINTRKFVLPYAALINLPLFLQPPYKTKSATTEAVAQKTQTPIVAKLTECEMGAHAHNLQSPEFAFLSNSNNYRLRKNSAIIPKKEKYTRFHTYSVSLALSL